MRTWICIGTLLVALSLHAQKTNQRQLWKVELYGALTNYETWEIEPTVTFQPIHYAGISLGLLFTQPYHTESCGGVTANKQLRWSCTDENSPSHILAFKPSLQFNSPRIEMGQDKEYALYFSVSPGITIPLPANQSILIDYFPNKAGVWTALRREKKSNTGARAIFFHLRTGISLEVDDALIFSVGYTLSDFDPYAGSRNIIVEGEKLKLPEHRLMHAGFVSIGYRF